MIKERQRKKKPVQLGNERDRIQAMFVKAMEVDGPGDSDKREEVAKVLEVSLHAMNNEAKYKAKARGIFANLKDPKNTHLREGLLDGSILPEELATMSYEEMVNPTIRLQR